MKPLTFYFFADRMAIRFHIGKRLLAIGWEKVISEDLATFGDRHLTLNDNTSQHIEFKHLLAQLMQKAAPELIPITYSLDDENFVTVFAKIIFEHYLPKGQYVSTIKDIKWILKPSTLNNGEGIQLFNNVDELKAYYYQPKRLGGPHVVQQYITHPHLINGRKYTFRLPVIFTNFAGIFSYKQGYVNIAAETFSLENDLKNRRAHITNYVLDGEFSPIEQRSTTLLPGFDKTYAQMNHIIEKVIKGLLKVDPNYLKPPRSKQVKKFEIFGFDFTMDETGKVFLLEINQGPDAPTFEENHLNKVLWDPFWSDVIDDFVLPIALDTEPKNNYGSFTQVLKPGQSYSFLRSIVGKFR